MGWRFYKSVKILPGVRLNFSKSGISTSLGRPGATVNIRSRKLRGTVGLPGSGLSYSKEVSLAGDEETATPPPRTGGVGMLRRLFGR